MTALLIWHGEDIDLFELEGEPARWAAIANAHYINGEDNIPNELYTLSVAIGYGDPDITPIKPGPTGKVYNFISICGWIP
jgi:hypothetical protein